MFCGKQELLDKVSLKIPVEIPRGMEWELRDQYLNRDVERGQENEGAHQDRELKKGQRQNATSDP